MLQLSTKFRYAFRILLYLAKSEDDFFIPASQIAEHENITPKYLETIMSSLLKTDWVISSRGAYGGYKLNVNPSELNVKQMVDYFEGKSKFIHCINKPSLCNHADTCISRFLWTQLEKEFDAMTEKVTLRALISLKQPSDIEMLFRNIKAQE